MKNKILLIFALLSIVFGAKAQKEYEYVVEVSGVASCKAIPEIARLQIPIVVEAIDYKVCSDSLMRKLKALQKELKQLGLPDKQLKTSGFSIEENYQYNNGKREKQGYRGLANLQVKDRYDARFLKEIIKILRENEATYSLSFILSEEQKEKLTKQLIDAAVKDASQKARMLAKASGVVLGNIAEIKYGSSQIYGGKNYLIQEEAEYADDATPMYNVIQQLDLAPNEISIQKTVLIRWAIDY